MISLDETQGLITALKCPISAFCTFPQGPEGLVPSSKLGRQDSSNWFLPQSLRVFTGAQLPGTPKSIVLPGQSLSIQTASTVLVAHLLYRSYCSRHPEFRPHFRWQAGTRQPEFTQQDSRTQ